MNNYFPQQFITQSYSDWIKNANKIYTKSSTKTRTVILPSNVNLSDKRLKEGVVVAERKYQLEDGKYPMWPKNRMFECDVDKDLLEDNANVHSHYSVYPNYCFDGLNCNLCVEG